jgi:hypothetical protein
VSALICIYKQSGPETQQIGCGIKVPSKNLSAGFLYLATSADMLRTTSEHPYTSRRYVCSVRTASVSICKYPDNLAGNRIAMMNYFDRLSKWWAPPRRVLAGRGAYGTAPTLKPWTDQGRIRVRGSRPHLLGAQAARHLIEPQRPSGVPRKTLESFCARHTLRLPECSDWRAYVLTMCA